MIGENKNTGTGRYGSSYWCIKTAKALSQSGEIYVMADELAVDSAGALICWGGYRSGAKPPEQRQAVLCLAPNQWTAFYAASLMDGAAVAVEYWSGEVAR